MIIVLLVDVSPWGIFNKESEEEVSN